MPYNIRLPQLFSSLEPTPEDNKNQVLLGLDGVVGWNTIDNDCILNNVQYYANFASLPVEGLTNVLYIPTDTKTLWQWNGSAYVQINNAGVPATYLQDTMTWTDAAKNIIWTHDSTETNACLNLHLRSKKKVKLTLQSDTDNTGETSEDHSVIEISSDNNSTLGSIGTLGSSGNLITVDTNFGTTFDNGMFINSNVGSGIYFGTSNSCKLAIRGTSNETVNPFRVLPSDSGTPQYGFIGYIGTGMQCSSAGVLRFIHVYNTQLEVSTTELKTYTKLNMNNQRLQYATFTGRTQLESGFKAITVSGCTTSNCEVIYSIHTLQASSGLSADLGVRHTGFCYSNNTIHFQSYLADGTTASNDTSTIAYTIIFKS